VVRLATMGPIELLAHHGNGSVSGHVSDPTSMHASMSMRVATGLINITQTPCRVLAHACKAEGSKGCRIVSHVHTEWMPKRREAQESGLRHAKRMQRTGGGSQGPSLTPPSTTTRWPGRSDVSALPARGNN